MKRKSQNFSTIPNQTAQSSFERIKTWRHPFNSQLNIRNKTDSNSHIGTEQQYNQICEILKFNYFDQSPVGTLIESQSKQNRLILNNIHEQFAKNFTTKKTRQQSEEIYNQNHEILKLQKMATAVKNYERDKNDQKLDNSTIKKDKGHKINKGSTYLQEKPCEQGKTSKLIKNPIQSCRDLLKRGSDKLHKQKTGWTVFQKQKQFKEITNEEQNKNKMRDLRKQIKNLEKQAVTNCGMKFTQLKVYEQERNQQRDQSCSSSEIEQQIIGQANYQDFQNRLQINFPGLKPQKEIQSIDFCIPTGFMNILKSNEEMEKKKIMKSYYKSKSALKLKTNKFLRV